MSHRHGLVFVKTWKTAGTSIECFLEQRVGDDAIVTPIYPQVGSHAARNHEPDPGGGRPRFYNHMPAAEMRRELGAHLWADYTTFCVERNPWDQVVSTYFMRRARNQPDLDWDEFIESRDFYRNHTRYTDPADPMRVLVDRIVHFEQLEAGLAEVFTSVGIPFDGDLGVRAKSGYRTDPRPYQAHFTDAQAAIVREELAVEIALNGYRF